MYKLTFGFYRFCVPVVLCLYLIACKGKVTQQHNGDSTVVHTTSSTETSLHIVMVDGEAILYKGPYEVHQSDTTSIKGTNYAMSILRTDSVCYFLVEHEQNGVYKPFMADKSFGTNNSSLVFDDCNHDGYTDIVWTKKWQDHAYLFDPARNTFVEVGEYNNVDTLRNNGNVVYYHNKPLLFLTNQEKDMEWMTQLHSELFTIDDNYRKVSFATIDNMSSTEEDRTEQLEKDSNVIVFCHVPPYEGRYGATSIWNKGIAVDSAVLKVSKFDEAYIKQYWQDHYAAFLQYGKVFEVRREKEEPLEYY